MADRAVTCIFPGLKVPYSDRRVGATRQETGLVVSAGVGGMIKWYGVLTIGPRTYRLRCCSRLQHVPDSRDQD